MSWKNKEVIKTHFLLYEDRHSWPKFVYVVSERCYSTHTDWQYLIFMGPCIVIYCCSTTNKMHLILELFILVKHSTCFGLSVHHQELKTAYTATTYVKQLLLSGMRWSSISSPITAVNSSCLTYTVAVYEALSSWWWTERPSETCRAFYKNK